MSTKVFLAICKTIGIDPSIDEPPVRLMQNGRKITGAVIFLHGHKLFCASKIAPKKLQGYSDWELSKNQKYFEPLSVRLWVCLIKM